MSYSISAGDPALPEPRVLVGRSGGGIPMSPDATPIPRFERDAGLYLLGQAGLQAAPQFVAFDMIVREEQPARPPKKPDASATFDSKGDRLIFDGMDSALKGSFYWHQRNINLGGSRMQLTVPLVVLALPLWNVSIDGGKIGDPEIKRRGYHTIHYPIDNAYAVQAVTTVVCDQTELDHVVVALDLLFAAFVDYVTASTVTS